MECETLGLKRWTCSRLCPSRSGNGLRGDENTATLDETSLLPTGLEKRREMPGLLFKSNTG